MNQTEKWLLVLLALHVLALVRFCVSFGVRWVFDTRLRFCTHVFSFFLTNVLFGNWQRHRPHCVVFSPKYSSQGKWQRHRPHFASLAVSFIPGSWQRFTLNL